MYCSHCGMKLPDWARYCERCGARVKHATTEDDPLEQIGLGDTSASEPLWAEDAQDVREEGAPAEQAPTTDSPTVLMDAADELAASAPQADSYDADKTIIDAASLFKRAMGDVMAQDASGDFDLPDLPDGMKAQLQQNSKQDDDSVVAKHETGPQASADEEEAIEDSDELAQPAPEEELVSPSPADEPAENNAPEELDNLAKALTPEIMEALRRLITAGDALKDEPATTDSRKDEEESSDEDAPSGSSNLTHPLPAEEPEAPDQSSSACNAEDDAAPASPTVDEHASSQPSDLTQPMPPETFEELAQEEDAGTSAEASDDEPKASQDESDYETPEPEQAISETAKPVKAQAPTERERIDVGEEESPIDMPVTMYRPYYDTWQGRQRPSERIKAQQSSPSFAVMAALAASIILLSFLVAHFVLDAGVGSQDDASTQQEEVATSKSVSKRKAKKIIEGLEGWWTTRRTFDGRFWRIKEGVLETYSADGNLTRQRPIDPDSIERMSEGPGGIEGKGYYLRDIAFYLVEDDPDTLHAISGDGSTNEDANLLRCDPPSFADKVDAADDDEKDEAPKEEEPAEEPEEPAEEEKQDDTSEYMLPESSTRVYELDELRQLSDHDLFIARNEIFAKHGYVFGAGGELNEYFGSKSWYQPAEVFNEGEMNEIERENVNNIYTVEQERNSQYL